MEKLKMHSADLSQQNIEKIRAVFPNCVTEAHSIDGSIKLAVDFDQLKQELSDSIVEGPQERYHLNWPGKREALMIANAPIAKTLRPNREESVDFDSTKNIFIEGDNLDALKLLQESYLGKVKMIYIDPPYNTGKDFIYTDNFYDSTSEFLKKSNQEDSSSNRLVSNSEANGRFHSDWLSMIYPRLKLARNLLKDNGVIFISIDDNEAHNLKKICDEIFGETNFLANIVWEKVHTRKNSSKYFSTSHEHILAYAKDKLNWDRVLLPREGESAYKNPDNHPKGPWKLDPITAHNEYSADYKITKPNGIELSRPQGRYWAFSKETIDKKIANDEIVWGTGDSYPMIKRFLSETQDGLVPITIFDRKFAGDTASSKKEIDAIFGENGLFEYAKPTQLIIRLMQISTRANDIVMDFFAGSGSTAHAVIKQNSIDGMNRKFICIQLPEVIDKNQEAYKCGYRTISALSMARIRKAGTQIATQNTVSKSWNKDTGFRLLRIDSSNMNDIYNSPNELHQSNLNLLVDNIKSDRTDEDLLFQVLLDWGVDLTLPIRKQKVAGKSVFIVDEGALVACFDLQITEQLVTDLAAHKPLRMVFRDDGFTSDAVKINAEQIFRRVAPHSELRTI